MLKRLLGAAAVIVCFSGPAQANDGNTLLRLCAKDKIQCGFVLQGVIEGLGPLAAAIGCLPGAARPSQLRDVLFKYIQSNPAKRHLYIPFLFDKAMTEAFNCPPVFALAYDYLQRRAPEFKPAPK